MPALCLSFEMGLLWSKKRTTSLSRCTQYSSVARYCGFAGHILVAEAVAPGIFLMFLTFRTFWTFSSVFERFGFFFHQVADAIYRGGLFETASYTNVVCTVHN